MSPQTRAVEGWTLQPLTDFVRESSVRLVLVLTPAGQVLAQSGFSRAVDVMSAAALAAAIVASTGELARQLGQNADSLQNLQGTQQGHVLAVCTAELGSPTACGMIRGKSPAYRPVGSCSRCPARSTTTPPGGPYPRARLVSCSSATGRRGSWMKTSKACRTCRAISWSTASMCAPCP